MFNYFSSYYLKFIIFLSCIILFITFFEKFNFNFLQFKDFKTIKVLDNIGRIFYSDQHTLSFFDLQI